MKRDEHSKLSTYWIVAFELSDIVPRRNPKKPNLYIAIQKRPAASEQVARELMRKQRKLFAPHIVKDFELNGLAGPYLRVEEAKKIRDQIALHLAWRGHVVNPSPTPSHRLYVIDLDPEILGNKGKKHVYEGSTSKSLKDRVEEHRKGVRTTSRRPSPFTTCRMASSWPSRYSATSLFEPRRNSSRERFASKVGMTSGYL